MAQLTDTIHIVGAGLAGSECAYQLAQMGRRVKLYEMRGKIMTPAHKTNQFAELVCSNSFGSTTDYSAPGQLKWEAEALNSLILRLAKKAAVPAGMALGVDRELFAQQVTAELHQHPNIEVVNEAIESLDDLPRPAVIATGPLTYEPLAHSIQNHFEGEFLYFFDAIAPVIDADTINTKIAFKADRFNQGTKDYYNCPLNKEQYYRLIEEIKLARKVETKEFEKTPYFEGCMPIEAIIERGDETLRFGPMSPKGICDPKNENRDENSIDDPRNSKNFYAIVQLRQDNKAATAYNMVGFQTKMAYGEQKRIFRMIPGLEEAEFLKLGSIHRNLYIQSPKLLHKDLSSRKDEWLYFAGQITGVEGYFESTCVGLMVAHFINNKLSQHPLTLPPLASAFGSLLNAITEDNDYFQPTNINFGLFPPVAGEKKHLKRELQLHHAKQALADYVRHRP